MTFYADKIQAANVQPKHNLNLRGFQINFTRALTKKHAHMYDLRGINRANPPSINLFKNTTRSRDTSKTRNPFHQYA